MDNNGFGTFILRILNRISEIENIRVHGLVLVVGGILLSLAIALLMIFSEYLGLNIPESELAARGKNPGLTPSVILSFAGLASIPIIGFGVVEIVTGIRWNAAKGVIPFPILAIVCIPLIVLFFSGSISLMAQVR